MIKKVSYFLTILWCGFVFGQRNKEQLQQQNAELKKQIANINANLVKARNESRLSVAYLEDVNKKIALREKVYNNTQKEKRFIEDEIYLSQLEINRQNKELGILRENYAKVLVKAYKNKDVQNKITFILSSKNLGEVIRRAQYLKRYSEYQDKKTAEITEAANKIKLAIEKRQNSIKEKDKLLENQKQDLSVIEVEREQKQVLIKEFKENEVKLTAELRQKQAQSKALDAQIRAIIAEEIKIAKAKEEADKKAEAERLRLAKLAAEREKARIDAENKAKAEALEKERKAAEAEAKRTAELLAKKSAEEKKRTEEAARTEASAKDEARRVAAEKDAKEAAEKAKIAANKAAEARAAEAELAKKKEAEKDEAERKVLTGFGVSSTASGSSFAENRGRMSMPVYGTITHRFGRQQHPVFKNIWEENSGIKIAAKKGSVAKAVFPGVVSRVIASSDGSRTVFIKHGTYFTIYSNLKSTSVSQNQQVSAGTTVGVIDEDFDGTTTLDFQIWNGSTPVDPLGWVN